MSAPPVVVRRERVIPIPADVLWGLIEPAETLPSWLPMGASCVRLEGEGLGRTQRLSTRWGRRTVEIDQRVTAYEPNSLLRWVHTDERIDGVPARRWSIEVTMTIRLIPTGPGTRVALESRSVPASPMARVFIRLVAARRIVRAFERGLAALADAST